MPSADEVLAFSPGPGLRRRLSNLAPAARAAFGVTCAQRMAGTLTTETGRALARDAIATAWAILADEDYPDPAPVLGRFDRLGQALDGDALACCYYALRAAVSGGIDDAVWAGDRAMEWAFDAVAGAVSSFAPLAVDAASDPVRAEYEAQTRALDLLATSGPTREILKQLAAG
jgi:hypothetical protein